MIKNKTRLKPTFILIVRFICSKYFISINEWNTRDLYSNLKAQKRLKKLQDIRIILSIRHTFSVQFKYLF